MAADPPPARDAPPEGHHGRRLPPLYAVLDVATLLRLGLADPTDLPSGMAATASALVGGGVRLLQVRLGDLARTVSPIEALRVARAAVDAAHEGASDALVVVNDDPGLALRSGADGVHLGASDPRPAAARRMLGPRALIGASVRDPRVLPVPNADYLGVGPVRATATKPGLPDPIGWDGVAAVASATSVPVYAIGGLQPADLEAARAAGAHGIALVTGLLAPLTAHAHHPAGGPR